MFFFFFFFFHFSISPVQFKKVNFICAQPYAYEFASNQYLKIRTELKSLA